MAETTCILCVEKRHRVYWGEMSHDEMEKSGTTFWKCYQCNHAPLVWNTGIGDAVCEGCGEWQEGRQK